MKFDLNEEQKILKEAAHKFLAKECSGPFVRQMENDARGFLAEHWLQMAEFGWLGLLFPEEYGGTGGNFQDLGVLLWEMGYAGWPGPFFISSMVCGLVLLEAGNSSQKKGYIEDISTGKKILTLALLEEQGTYEAGGIRLRAEKRKDHYLISGVKLFVPYAPVSDFLICAARTRENGSNFEEGISLFLIDGRQNGISMQQLDTIGDDKQYEVTFDQVQVPLENMIGSPDQAWPILKSIFLKGAVAKCAEMSGGAQRVLDFVVPYVKERIQFGQPVGSFQAVQHHCANMLTYVDTMKFITDQTIWKISQDRPYSRDASICKAWVSDSYKRMVALAHQVMGGIGFMEEHDLQFYFRRAKVSELLFGDADFHRKLVAQDIGHQRRNT